MLVDQTIGEVSAIAFVAGFDVYAQPKGEPAMLLSQLPELLQSMGHSLWRDGSDYLENSYLAYELKPVEDLEADWRLDVYTGSCRLPVLINDYLTAAVIWWMSTTRMALPLDSSCTRCPVLPVRNE